MSAAVAVVAMVLLRDAADKTVCTAMAETVDIAVCVAVVCNRRTAAAVSVEVAERSEDPTEVLLA